VRHFLWILAHYNLKDPPIEVANVVSPNEPNTARHDILEVNHYFISGLTESSIDRWFIGPTPNFTLVDLNIPELQGTTLSQAIDRALKVVDDPMQTAWQMVSAQSSQSYNQGC